MRRRRLLKTTRTQRLLLVLLLAGLVSAHFLYAPPPSAAAPVLRGGTGATPAEIQGVMDLFRGDIGGVNNGVGGGSLSGRREINWDDVPDNLAAPNDLPNYFYNNRGALLVNPGGTAQVSMDDDNPPDADPDQVRFDNLNPGYSAIFKTFSGQRLLSPIGANTIDVSFFVPGTSISATVSGFGAVFLDVDRENWTTMVYYNASGQMIGFTIVAPRNNGLSFAGVTFNAGERIALVHIVLGNAVAGANDVDGPSSPSDVVMLDDMIYGEPQPIPNPNFLRWTGGGGNANWSTAGNWQGGVAPNPNTPKSLEFPAGAGALTNVNDFGTAIQTPVFNSLTFSGGGYNIGATFHDITLINGIRTQNQTGNNTLSMNVGVPSSTTFLSENPGTSLIFNAKVITATANPLTLDGAGDFAFNDQVGPKNGFDGFCLIVKNGSGTARVGDNFGHGFLDLHVGMEVNAGTLLLSSSSNGGVALNGGTLSTTVFNPAFPGSGSAQIGGITATGGTIQPGGANGIGILRSGGTFLSQILPAVTPGANLLAGGGLTLSAAATLELELNGTEPGGVPNPGGISPSEYDRLEVIGPVSLGGKLNLHLNYLPAESSQWVIIDNKDNPTNGGGAIHYQTTGTFDGLPEGTVFPFNGFLFKITYHGGDGNDVVLTGVPKLNINDVTVTEGNSGTTNAVFTVTLSSPSTQIVTVDFGTLDGTATAGSDYGPRSGTRIFNPGQVSQTITIPVTGDTNGEPNENFFIFLTDPIGAAVAHGMGMATIVNDDGPPVAASLSINSPTATEGDNGTTNLAFTVTLSAASSQTVTVDYLTSNGSAASPTDYQTVAGTLIFNPGQTTRTINVPVVGDTLPEPSETLFVNLFNPTNASITTPQGTGTIIDNDATGVLQFSTAGISVAENAGHATITVTRTGDTSGAASVDYETSDGTAQQKSDYIFGSGVIQFGPGETSKTFNLLLVNDVYVEGNETLSVALSNPSGSFVLGSPNSIVVTINDDDSVTPTTNPADDAQFFVRQQYLDFLNREPDAGGLSFWVGKITACGADSTCLSQRRLDVSAAFFQSDEFQRTGGFIIRAYKAAFDGNTGVRPSYLEFMRGRGRIVVGQDLETSKAVYVNNFVGRPEFTAAFPLSLSAALYVDLLNANTGNSLTQVERDALVSGLALGTETRATVLQKVADNTAFAQHEANPAFVMMEYYGYLRRDLDLNGFSFWLNILSGGAQRGMVCAFANSAEYQLRFSPIVTRNDIGCSGF